MDLDSEYFNVNKYTTELLRRESLKGLVESDTRLLRSVRQLDSQLQELVYQNYAKFITATDTIREMRDHAAEMDAKLLTLSSSVDTVDALSQRVRAELQTHRSRIEETISANRMLKKVQFLLTLPDAMRRLMEHEEYTAAVKYWVVGDSFLAKHTSIAAIAKIKEECTALARQLYAQIESVMCAFPLNELDAMDSIGALVENLRLLRATSLFRSPPTSTPPTRRAGTETTDRTPSYTADPHYDKENDTRCTRTASLSSDRSFEETVLQSLMRSVAANFHREVAVVLRGLCAAREDTPLLLLAPWAASPSGAMTDDTHAPAASVSTGDVAPSGSYSTSTSPSHAREVNSSATADRAHVELRRRSHADTQTTRRASEEDAEMDDDSAAAAAMDSTPLARRHELISGADVRDALAQLKSSCATLAANTTKVHELLLGGGTNDMNMSSALMHNINTTTTAAAAATPFVRLSTSALIQVVDAPNGKPKASGLADTEENTEQIEGRAAGAGMTTERYIARTVQTAWMAVLDCVVSRLARRTTSVLRSIIHQPYSHGDSGDATQLPETAQDDKDKEGGMHPQQAQLQHDKIMNSSRGSNHDETVHDNTGDASSVHTAAHDRDDAEGNVNEAPAAASLEDLSSSLTATVNAALAQLRYVALTMRALGAHYAELPPDDASASWNRTNASSAWFATQVDEAVCSVLRRIAKALCQGPLYRVRHASLASLDSISVPLHNSTRTTRYTAPDAHSFHAHDAPYAVTPVRGAAANSTAPSQPAPAHTSASLSLMPTHDTDAVAAETRHEQRLRYALTCLMAAMLASRLGDGVHTTLLVSGTNSTTTGTACATTTTAMTSNANANANANAHLTPAATMYSTPLNATANLTSTSAQMTQAAFANASSTTAMMMSASSAGGGRSRVGAVSAAHTPAGPSLSTTTTVALTRPDATTTTTTNHSAVGGGGLHHDGGSVAALSAAAATRIASELYAWSTTLQSRVAILMGQAALDWVWQTAVWDAVREEDVRMWAAQQNNASPPSSVPATLGQEVKGSRHVREEGSPHTRLLSTRTRVHAVSVPSCLVALLTRWMTVYMSEMPILTPPPPPASSPQLWRSRAAHELPRASEEASLMWRGHDGGPADELGTSHAREDWMSAGGGGDGAAAAGRTRRASQSTLPRAPRYALTIPSSTPTAAAAAASSSMSHSISAASQLSVSYTRQTEKVMLQNNVEQIFLHETTSRLSMSVTPGQPATLIRAALLFLLKGLVDRMSDVARDQRAGVDGGRGGRHADESDRRELHTRHRGEAAKGGEMHEEEEEENRGPSETEIRAAETIQFQRIQLGCTYLLRAILAPPKGSVGRRWLKEWNSSTVGGASHAENSYLGSGGIKQHNHNHVSGSGGVHSATARTIQRLLDELCTCAYERTRIPPQPLPQATLDRLVEQALMRTAMAVRPTAAPRGRSVTTAPVDSTADVAAPAPVV